MEEEDTWTITFSNKTYDTPSPLKLAALPNSAGRLNRLLFANGVVRSLNEEYKKAVVSACHMNSDLLGKSNDRSVTIRLNVQITDEESYFESLWYFTKSIALAEDGSEELGLAYRARSMLQFKLRLHEQFEADMKRSWVLFEKNNKETDVLNKTMTIFYNCEEWKYPRRPVARLRLANDNTKRVAGIIKEERPTVSVDAEDRDSEWRDMCRRLDNRCIQNASSKIRLGYDEGKWGRFVQATEDLEAGEVIAVQEFFTAYLRNGLEHVRCSLCVALCTDLIPCPTCCMMMYCSEYCRNLAYNLYHRMECKIMKLFFTTCNLNRTEFRVVRQLLIGTEQGFQLAKLMERIRIEDIMGTDFPPSEIFKDEYETTLRLHKSYSQNQMWEFVPFVAQMVDILQYVGFFDEYDRSRPYDPDRQSDKMTKPQAFTAFLLLNHIVGMDNYLFDVKIIREKYAPFDDDGTIVADGFCTFFPVFNHSCDANVFIMPRNLQAAFITRRPIAKGEEITVSYGLVGEGSDFECQCDACMNGWYTLNHLRLTSKFRNHITDIPEIVRSELRTMLRPVADLMKSKSLRPNEILRIVLYACKWLYTNINKYPTMYHLEIQRLVSLFMRLFYGTLNEHIPLEAVIEEAYYSVWLNIMVDLHMDFETA